MMIKKLAIIFVLLLIALSSLSCSKDKIHIMDNIDLNINLNLENDFSLDHVQKGLKELANPFKTNKILFKKYQRQVKFIWKKATLYYTVIIILEVGFN